MSQLLLDISLHSAPCLDNFVAGRNLELLTALRQALSRPSGERCFYLWGEVGSGKTHLLQACVQAEPTAIYAHAQVPAEIDEFNLIAIDDVDGLDEQAQIELFGLYNQVRDCGGMLIVSGKQSPLHLPLREDLRTRLCWGLVYQVHGLSDEEKIHALEQRAQSRGFSLPSEVSQYLLRHGRRDLPYLLAVLDALDVHSLRLHRAPSVPLLKEVLFNFESE